MINYGMTFSQAAAASTFTIGYSFTPQWGMGRQQNINSNMLSNGSAYNDAVVAHGNYQRESKAYYNSMATSGGGIAPAYQGFQEWYKESKSWMSKHFEIGYNYEYSVGLQAGAGLKNGAQGYINYKSYVRSDASWSNKSNFTGNNYHIREKVNRGIGLAFYGGFSYDSQTYKGVTNKSFSVGVLGLFVGEISWNNKEGITNWFWGINPGLSMAFIFGINIDGKIGFSK